MAVIHLGMLYSHQKKFTNATSSLFRRLSVCKTMVCSNSVINQYTEVLAPASISYVWEHKTNPEMFFFSHGGSPFSLKSTYCTFQYTGQKLSPDSKL
jgi:hypothetical protein